MKNIIWLNKNCEKIKDLKFLDFALVTDGFIKVFDDTITFETCDQVIFITYSLKINRIKFHGFSMKRTGFIVIFLAGAKTPPTPCAFHFQEIFHFGEIFAINKCNNSEAAVRRFLQKRCL